MAEEPMSPEEKLLKDPASSSLTGEALANALFVAARKEPDRGLMYAKSYMGYIPQELVSSFLNRVARENPVIALLRAKDYIELLPQDEGMSLLKRAAQIDPRPVLASASSFMEFFPKEEQRQIVLDAISRGPKFGIFQPQTYMPYVLPEDQGRIINAAIDAVPPLLAFYKAPLYKEYLSQQEMVGTLLRLARKNTSDAFDSLKHYIDFIPEAEKGSFVNDLAHHAVNEMMYGSHNLKNPKIGDLIESDVKRDLEVCSAQKGAALRIGYELNAGHNLSDAERFASIQGYDARQLYNLLTFGREELYTSSYAGVLDRLVEKLKQSNQNIFDVHDPRFGKALPVFMEAAAAYDKLDKVMPFIPADKWGDVLNAFGQRIEKGDTQMAVGLADIMHKTQDPTLKGQMEAFVQERYNRHAGVRDEVADVYGVLGNYYNHLTQAERIHLPTPERYQTPVMKGLTPEQVRGPDGVHRQMSVFTNDEDGNNSFSHFMDRYKKNKNYRVEDKGEYVRITPTNGAKMEIYANKPAGSPDAVLKALGGPDAKPEDVPMDLLIHRGHSYNFGNTLPYVSRHNSLIFVGSCGGYQNISTLLQRSPDTQVISTQATGSMAVNDPLLYHLNDSIRTGQPLVWSQERQYLEGLGSQHKKSYVLPDQNTALLMRQRLNELERERTHPEPLPVKPESALPPANDFNAIAAALSPRDPESAVDLSGLHSSPQPGTPVATPSALPVNPTVRTHLPHPPNSI